MSVPPNVLGSISMGISISISISIGSISISIVLGSISMDTMCVRCKTNVLTVDTMWTVEDKCAHESQGSPCDDQNAQDLLHLSIIRMYV